MPNETDLLLTELRKAIRVEPGDYIVMLNSREVSPLESERWRDLAHHLWTQNIRLYFIGSTNPDAVRFVRVESPETIKIEEP